MTTSAVRAASALALAATCVAPTQGQAARARVNNYVLTFTPPLAFEDGSGQVRIDFQVQCPDLPGQPAEHYSGSSAGIEYFGSCAAAVFAEGTRTVLLGGVLYLYVAGGQAKPLVLQPSQPCAPGASVASAHGTGVEVSYP